MYDQTKKKKKVVSTVEFDSSFFYDFTVPVKYNYLEWIRHLLHYFSSLLNVKANYNTRKKVNEILTNYILPIIFNFKNIFKKKKKRSVEREREPEISGKMTQWWRTKDEEDEDKTAIFISEAVQIPEMPLRASIGIYQSKVYFGLFLSLFLNFKLEVQY